MEAMLKEAMGRVRSVIEPGRCANGITLAFAP